ncbi:MAG: ABC transporter ATP-binding protein [Magnetococcales bacterium]|nr:ABC transporter ATP-binding protein [Magnetococcales bacterium]
MPLAIEITDLRKSFGKRAVLAGLDLHFQAGDRVALVGSNGAGKTTLIRCLLGEYHAQGRLRVAGLDPLAQRVEVLRRVGFVPQLPPPLRLRVDELIDLGARLAGVDPATIGNVAGQLGLDVTRHARQTFAKLSGGMKQKLLIAIALGRRPDVLIMDEPAANLDPEARRAFYGLLAQCPPETIMLLSSHRVDEIAGLVNRLVEMDQGVIILDEGVGRGDIAGQLLACRLELSEPLPAVTAELERWRFVAKVGGCVWTGHLAAPDRHRFLAAMARFAGQIVRLAWGGEEKG